MEREITTIHSSIEQTKVNKREKDEGMIEVNCPKTPTEYGRCIGGVNKADIMKFHYAVNPENGTTVYFGIFSIY